MGNSFTCLSPDEHQTKQQKPSKPSRRLSLIPSFRRRTLLPSLSCSSSSSSSKKHHGRNNSSHKSKKKTRERHDGAHEKDHSLMIQEQTLAATNLLFNQQSTPRNSGSAVPFRRSTSVVYPSPLGPNTTTTTKKPPGGVVRSSSSRQRASHDPLIKPNQLLDQNAKKKVDGVETKHLVLVHGGGFGAWCWYKTMTLLEKDGYQVDAVDLTASGVSSSDTNSITSLDQYAKPLIDFFQALDHKDKVILVGHDFGGACVTYVMEMFPSKIAKAVFIAAAMLSDGQSTLDLFIDQPEPTDLLREAHVFLYANGKKSPPTAIDFDRSLIRDLLFNQSPLKDVALASVSMRSIPFAPVTEKLHMTEKNYGSIPRYYVKTLEDYAVPVSLQDAMIRSNPPEQVFQLKGSDHAPFFSRPQSLNRILVEISQIPSGHSA